MRFPIAEALLAGNLQGLERERLPRISEVVDSCQAFVRCDEVARYFWQAEQDSFDYESNQFGIARPPFTRMFFEWQSPDVRFIYGRFQSASERAGYPITDRSAAITEASEQSDGTVRVDTYAFSWPAGPTPLYFPQHESIVLDHHGLLRAESKVVLVDSPYAEKFQELEHDLTYESACITKMAISFMHCKSASIDWHEVPPKVAKKRERTGPTVTKYAVINLPKGMNTRTTTRSQREDTVGDHATPHWVRGHFKTYTSDAPLLGRHIGSWWWQPSVRGAGEAPRKIYDVSPA